MSIQVSIIFPAYNEERRIKRTLEYTLEYLKTQNYTYEIIVVDDGSRDKTIETVKAVSSDIKIIPLGVNSGKGAAVRRGMLEAKGNIRVFSDSDLSTPIYELDKFMRRFYSGIDVCIGSRALNRDNVKERQAFYREAMGKTFNKFVQYFVFEGITDTQCGFKGFTAAAAEKIFKNAKIDGFSFDVEALYLAHIYSMKIEQVSVEWYNDDRSTVNPITDSIKMFLEILRIKRLHKNDALSITD